MTTIIRERFDIPTLNGGRVRTSLAELGDEVLIKAALAGDPVSIREVFRRYDLEQDQAAKRARKRRKKVSRRVWSRGLALMRIIIRNRLEPARKTLEKLEAYGLVIRVNDKLVVPEWLRTTARIAARQVGDRAAPG